MREIIGNTTATPNPRPDWNQADEMKADYIKNKPTKLSEFKNDIGISGDGSSIVVDSELSTESENPVQNKVITDKINEVEETADAAETKADEALSTARDAHYMTTELSVLVYDNNAKLTTIEGEMPNKQDKLEAGDNITIEGNVISAIIPEAEDIDLSEYVKKTDYASKDKGGVVRIFYKNDTSNTTGLTISGNGVASVFTPTTELIDDRGVTSKGTFTNPITVNTLDYAVKSGLTTNTIQLTDDEKAAARAWLGITNGGGGSSIVVDSELDINSENPVQNKKITERLNEINQTASAAEATASDALEIASAVQNNIAYLEDDNTNNKERLDTIETKLPKKQDTLIAGENISIIGNTISATGGLSGSVAVDSTLSTTSTNPVQNKAITEKINEVEEKANSAIDKIDGAKIEVNAGSGWTKVDFNVKAGVKMLFTCTASTASSFGVYVFDSNNTQIRVGDTTKGGVLEYTPTADIVKIGSYINGATATVIVNTVGYDGKLAEQDEKISEQDEKIAEVNERIDDTNQTIVEVKKWNNAININFESQDQNSGNAVKGGDKSGWWSVANNTKHYIIPISYGMRVKVLANKEYDTDIFFMSSYSAPTASNSPFNIVSIVTVEKDTTKKIPVPYGSKYVLVNICNVSLVNKLPQSMSIEFDEEMAEVYRNAKTKNLSVQFGEPITILSNNDTAAVDEEKLRLSYFNIVQLSDKMYYLYYEGKGEGDTGDYKQNLLFAYSTDGINYTRGFPEGINPPVEGTNKIFDDTNFVGQNIFKCLDPEYSWRMVYQRKDANGHNNVYMIKSKDGIKFDDATKRILQYGVVDGKENIHDTQYGVVCRGNIIKFFSRKNVNYNVNGITHKSREITVAYYDLDGNTISTEKTLPLKYVYNSASIPIDDRHEIIIPTGFDNTKVNGVADDSYTLNVYGVDGYIINENVDHNISSIIEENDKWISFVPSMITIGGIQYLAYMTWDFSHDTAPTLGTSVCRYKIVPVVIDRE